MALFFFFFLFLFCKHVSNIAKSLQIFNELFWNSNEKLKIWYDFDVFDMSLFKRKETGQLAADSEYLSLKMHFWYMVFPVPITFEISFQSQIWKKSEFVGRKSSNQLG